MPDLPEKSPAEVVNSMQDGQSILDSRVQFDNPLNDRIDPSSWEPSKYDGSVANDLALAVTSEVNVEKVDEQDPVAEITLYPRDPKVRRAMAIDRMQLAKDKDGKLPRDRAHDDAQKKIKPTLKDRKPSYRALKPIPGTNQNDRNLWGNVPRSGIIK